MGALLLSTLQTKDTAGLQRRGPALAFECG